MNAAGIVLHCDGVAVDDTHYSGSVACAGQWLSLDNGSHEDDGEAKQKNEEITDDFVVHGVVPFENSRFFYKKERLPHFCTTAPVPYD